MKPVAALALVMFAAAAGAVTVASPASAQIVGMTATFAPISAGRPGTTSPIAVTFTTTQDLGPVRLDLFVGNPPPFDATTVDAANTTGELTNCTTGQFGASCDWDAQVADGPQTLAVTLAIPPDTPWPAAWNLAASASTTTILPPLAEASLPIEPPVGSMALSGTVRTTGGIVANACVFLIVPAAVFPVVADDAGNWSASGLPDGTSWVIAVAPGFSGPGGPCQITGVPQPPGPGELQPEWVDNVWIDLADPDLINVFASPYEYAVAHGATVFSTPTSGIDICLTTTPGDVVPRPPCQQILTTTTAPSTTTTDPGTTTSSTASPTSAAAGTLPATGGGSGGSVPVAGVLALVAGAVLVVSQRHRRPLSGRQQSSRQGIER